MHAWVYYLSRAERCSHYGGGLPINWILGYGFLDAFIVCKIAPFFLQLSCIIGAFPSVFSSCVAFSTGAFCVPSDAPIGAQPPPDLSLPGTYKYILTPRYLSFFHFWFFPHWSPPSAPPSVPFILSSSVSFSSSFFFLPPFRRFPSLSSHFSTHEPRPP